MVFFRQGQRCVVEARRHRFNLPASFGDKAHGKCQLGAGDHRPGQGVHRLRRQASVGGRGQQRTDAPDGGSHHHTGFDHDGIGVRRTDRHFVQAHRSSDAGRPRHARQTTQLTRFINRTTPPRDDHRR